MPAMTASAPQRRDVIEVFVPGKLQQVANGSLSRAHWSRKSAWAKGWTNKTRLVLLRNAQSFGDNLAWKKYCPAPKQITFLAQVGALWDDDNLPGAIKPIRDALIGYVIHSDAPDSGHRFEYAQVVNRKERGVRITITPVAP